MQRVSQASSKAEETRQQLIRAATTAFAYEGFHAASLKRIAREAGVNQALIAYHFENKQGLYLAVFRAIVDQVQARVGPRMTALQDIATADSDALRRALFAMVDGILELLSGDDGREWALLITREQASPTEAFELIYEGFMGKALGAATRVMRMLKPEVAESDARLFVVLLLGQILVFRVSRTAVLRHMAWREYGEAELAASKRLLHQNITAWLSS